MRNTFAREILALAAADDRIVLLSGDIGNRLFDKFKAAYPDRFYNCGIAEAGMIGIAAGLALAGYKPVCYTIAPFLTYRCLEQIRVDLCYHNLPVVLVGTGGGLSYASLGATHHSCEELGMLRLLPNMQVFAAADSPEVSACLRVACQATGPVYLRIGKKGEAAVHREIPHFEPGRAIIVHEDPEPEVYLLSTGTVLNEAIAAAEELRRHGLSVGVASLPSIKPVDLNLLRRVFAECQAVATIEEHSILGGLGGAVAEWAAECEGSRARFVRCGTPDEFYHGHGSQEEARVASGIAAPQIAERVLKLLTPQLVLP